MSFFIILGIAITWITIIISGHFYLSKIKANTDSTFKYSTYLFNLLSDLIITSIIFSVTYTILKFINILDIYAMAISSFMAHLSTRLLYISEILRLSKEYKAKVVIYVVNNKNSLKDTTAISSLDTVSSKEV